MKKEEAGSLLIFAAINWRRGAFSYLQICRLQKCDYSLEGGGRIFYPQIFLSTLSLITLIHTFSPLVLIHSTLNDVVLFIAFKRELGGLLSLACGGIWVGGGSGLGPAILSQLFHPLLFLDASMT